MTNLDTGRAVHADENELADLLSGRLAQKDRKRVEAHIAACPACLAAVSSAHESVSNFRKEMPRRKGKAGFMKRVNIYLLCAVVSFMLSFIVPRFFLQLLGATLLLGAKWIVDAKSTKMLIMIYEAWKHGGEKEASRILETLESDRRNRM